MSIREIENNDEDDGEFEYLLEICQAAGFDIRNDEICIPPKANLTSLMERVFDIMGESICYDIYAEISENIRNGETLH